MRVIYPNRLKATISNWIVQQHRETFKFPQEIPITELKDLIDITPTVKAIPIEWIKNYASHKASKDFIDCYWHFWEDDVLKMIADWEKKNARD